MSSDPTDLHAKQASRSRAWLSALGTVAVAVAVAGILFTTDVIGSDSESNDPAPKSGPPDDTDQGNEGLVSCGGSPGWPASVMANGVPGLLDQAEATRTFQNILSDPRWSGEAELSILKDGVDTEWRVLAASDTTLTVGLGEWTDMGPAASDAWVLGLERDAGRWKPTGWGDCTLAPVLDAGTTWAQVNSYSAADADATSLQVRVSETECTSGRDPSPYLHEPVVVESPETVTISWTSTPMSGGANCPGNPSVTRSIDLMAPLGDREVLDGSTFPARPVPTD